jgi:TonB family protein
MKSACDPIREWLGAFVDKELDPARAEQVRTHLETCADCRRELDQIQELHRLAKSVEHPRLAEDYWDWQRTRVWRGIRDRKRAPTPWYRPTFVWPRLAAVAAGVVVVLVVAISGWRSFLPKSGLMQPVGELTSEPKRAAEQPVAALPGARSKTAAGKVAEPVADVARVGAEGRIDGLAQAPAGAARDAEKTEVGYAGKGAAAGAATSREATAPRRGDVAEMEAAARKDEGLVAAPATGGPQVLASSRKENRIVSGPVLLESPSLPDADALDTGTVLLSVNTDSTGRVLSAGVRRSSGSAKLDSLAVRQMRQSRFRAALKKNRHVASSFEYPFRLQKKPARTHDQDDEEAPKQSDRVEQQKQKEEHKIQEQKSQPEQDDESEDREQETQGKPTRERR